MSLWRYNWLRRLGYLTLSGTNWKDSDFGNTWAELIMSNGKKVKKVKKVNISGGVTVRDIQLLEKYQLTSPEKNGKEK